MANEALKLEWKDCPCGSCKRSYPSNLGTFYEGSGFDPDERVLLDRALATLSSDAVAGGEPYAYEFGRSNGDFTFSVCIERSPPPNPHPDWPVTALYAAPPEPAQLRERVKELTAQRDEYYARGYGLRCWVLEFLNSVSGKEALRDGFSAWESASGTRFSLEPCRVREGGKVDG